VRRSQAASLGFTLIELLVVVALIGIVAGMVSMSLRDPSIIRLEQEGARLSTLLEMARSKARASHLEARWELNRSTDPGDFHFVGLPSSTELPTRWLSEGIKAQIVGANALKLGPEPLIGPQRVVLQLGERQLTVATDGLSPFTVEGAGP
jgi:general secretion pathway protein H